MQTIADLQVDEFRFVSDQSLDSHGHARSGHPAEESRMALLTVTTDTGEKGYSFQNPEQLRPHIVQAYLRPAIIGQPALARERIWQRLARMKRGSSGLLTDKAMSAVDQALWDLIGRIANMPVHMILGASRDTVPAYASIMCGDGPEGALGTPDDYADYALALVERGYKGIKLHTWMPPTPGAPDPKRDLAACSAVREAVGPDIVLMLDGYHWYTRTQALKIGRALEQLDFAWFEEPMDENSMSSYVWLADKLDIPVIGPETAMGGVHVRAEWIAAGACDVLRAGVLRAGGITPTIKVAHLAEAHGMNCEIHGNGAASLAVCLSISNCCWYERGLLHPQLDYDRPKPYLNQICDPMDSDGLVRPTGLPGLGDDINFEYIADNRVTR